MTVPVKWLTSQLAIAGQIQPQDLPAISEMGFKTVICNRPDFENGPGQPTAEEIRQAAKAKGISFAFHPVPGNGGTASDALEMAKLMNELPKPILSYCYSGGRCMALIGLAARMGESIPQ